MKKGKLLLLPVALMMLASCGGGGKSAEQEAADSAARADSIAAAEAAAEAARLDSIRQDSIRQAEVEEMFAKGVTATPGKKSYGPGAGECASVKLPITITNNTDITLEPADYVVTYSVAYDTSSDGSSPAVYKSKSISGPAIAPGESATVTASDNCCSDISKASAKLKISKEDFAARRAAK